MKHTPDRDGCLLTLNGMPLRLSEQDIRDLDSLTACPGYLKLKEILQTMVQGTRDEMERDWQLPIEQFRAFQGRLSVAREVAELLDDGIPKLVAARNKER